MDNLPMNVEVKADLTEPIRETRNELLSPLFTQLGNGLGFVGECFSLITGFWAFKLKTITEEKKMQFKSKMEEKFKSIPKEKLVEPDLRIFSESIRNIAYTFDEEIIRDAFLNILMSDMNSDTKTTIHPSYISIVSQLSKEDAIMLKFLKETFKNPKEIYKPICVLGMKDQDNNHYNCFKTRTYAFNLDGYNYNGEISSIAITNLERLGIVYIDNIETITNKNLYSDLKVKIDSYYSRYINELEINLPGKKLTIEYRDGYFMLTNYGKNLINICFEEK